MELFIDELGEYIEIEQKSFQKDYFNKNVRLCGGDMRKGKVLGTVTSNNLEGYKYIVIVNIGDSVIGFHPMSLLPILENSCLKQKQCVINFDILNKHSVTEKRGTK